MALGEFRLFQFKSKTQREKEKREYAAWAFPYGEIQRERLCELACEMDPKIHLPLYLASFLTCKELYERTLEDSDSRENATDKMINSIKSYGQLIKKSEMPMYLAFVLADADIDENCIYPSADEMRVRTQELIDKRNEKKSRLFKDRNKKT